MIENKRLVSLELSRINEVFLKGFDIYAMWVELQSYIIGDFAYWEGKPVQS